MGWTKVCGTTRSGIWVLKGNARARMLPENLDHHRVGWKSEGSYETAWVTPGHDCPVSIPVWTWRSQTANKLITPSGMGYWFVGQGRTPLITSVW